MAAVEWLIALHVSHGTALRCVLLAYNTFTRCPVPQYTSHVCRSCISSLPYAPFPLSAAAGMHSSPYSCYFSAAIYLQCFAIGCLVFRSYCFAPLLDVERVVAALQPGFTPRPRIGNAHVQIPHYSS